ncbi:hypothetical protein UXP85_04140 [Enterobacter cloacae]
MKESLMSAGVVLLSVLIVASFLKMYLLGLCKTKKTRSVSGF